MLRTDLQLIFDWVAPQSQVLDLGCGDGRLLRALIDEKQCCGYGVEIDIKRVIAASKNQINVIQADLERGLRDFQDDSFDMIILSQTIQAMKNTEKILQDMLRVARQAIVTFPNFGYWKNRLQIGLRGHMPVSEKMPYQWYNTPNIHWCTLVDFDELCRQNRIRIVQKVVATQNKQIHFLPNLRGSLAIYQISR